MGNPVYDPGGFDLPGLRVELEAPVGRVLSVCDLACWRSPESPCVQKSVTGAVAREI